MKYIIIYIYVALKVEIWLVLKLCVVVLKLAPVLKLPHISTLTLGSFKTDHQNYTIKVEM